MDRRVSIVCAGTLPSNAGSKEEGIVCAQLSGRSMSSSERIVVFNCSRRFGMVCGWKLDYSWIVVVCASDVDGQPSTMLRRREQLKVGCVCRTPHLSIREEVK